MGIRGSATARLSISFAESPLVFAITSDWILSSTGSWRDRIVIPILATILYDRECYSHKSRAI